MNIDLILRLGLVVLGLVGVPLALGLVPPNGLYGVRTRKTLATRDAWFAVNRWAGLALVFGAALGFLWLHLAPARIQVGPGAPTAIPMLVVALAALASWVALRLR